MKTEARHRRALPLAVLVLALCALGAERAHAFCQPGDVQACTVNGQPGTRTCQPNGMYGVCTPTVLPAPPVPAKPRFAARTANSLNVTWTDPTMWSGASYQLQRQVGSSWITASNINASPFAVWDLGFSADTKYCYRVEVVASTGVRRSEPACRYTTDGTDRAPWRVRMELHTGAVDDAGTDDDIVVSLVDSSGGMNYTWLDYGRDDFERGDTFKYDLNLDDLGLVTDINRIRITKDGTDGWCLADFRLLVNELPVYSEDFHALPGGCRWIDGNDGHQPTYEVAHATIRADALWQGYVEPPRISVDQSAFPLITATLRISKAEAEERLEGMIGSLLFGTEAYWGELHGPRYLEAEQGETSDRQAVDLDLQAEVDGWFDPEVDIDFDLHYEPSCSSDQTRAIVGITAENLRANVDFNWFTEFLSAITLPCTVANCVTRIEDYIADAIEDAFDPIPQSPSQMLPAGTRCLSAEAVVDQGANVNLVFQLEAPPPSPTPTPTPGPTPVPTPHPIPSPHPTPHPHPSPPPDPCEVHMIGGTTSIRNCP